MGDTLLERWLSDLHPRHCLMLPMRKLCSCCTVVNVVRGPRMRWENYRKFLSRLNSDFILQCELVVLVVLVSGLNSFLQPIVAEMSRELN